MLISSSIENFARSWTRAAGFPEVAPQHQSFVYADDDTAGYDETIDYGRQDPEHSRLPRHSLLGAHLGASGAPENTIDDESVAPENEARPTQPLLHKESAGGLGSDRPSNQGSVRGSQSMFGMGPNLAGSYGTSYGTMHSVLDEPSMNRAAELWRQQEAAATQLSEGDREPLVLKSVEQDGKKVLVIAGRSTLPQTIFNSTNVLIGVGLLSLPMGIKYAGWLIGMGFLFLSAVITSYTARVLAKCMDVDASLITFADLAFVSYGHKARIATSVLFMLELLAACVALIVLFADTLNLLIPAIEIDQWKILCGLLMIPLNFLPLRLLSFTSVIGIFSCFSSKFIHFCYHVMLKKSPGLPGVYFLGAITMNFPGLFHANGHEGHVHFR